MKKTLLATASVLVLSTFNAMAADLSMPVKAPPMAPAAVPSWAGFYLGAHVGYDWSRAHVFDNGVLAEDAVPMDGAVGGLLGGINWQTNTFVYGLEADFGIANLRGTGVVITPPSSTPNQYKVDFTANVRGRVGVSLLPTTMIYVAGGLALANFEFREHGASPSVTNILTGWTIGGGVDQSFTPNIIGRIEYLYSDFGHRDFNVAPTDVYNIGFKSQTVRGALIWKF